LFKHVMFWALALARASAGSKRAARMAIIAITTRSSISVNAHWRIRLVKNFDFEATIMAVVLGFPARTEVTRDPVFHDRLRGSRTGGKRKFKRVVHNTIDAIESGLLVLNRIGAGDSQIKGRLQILAR